MIKQIMKYTKENGLELRFKFYPIEVKRGGKNKNGK